MISEGEGEKQTKINHAFAGSSECEDWNGRQNTQATWRDSDSNKSILRDSLKQQHIALRPQPGIWTLQIQSVGRQKNSFNKKKPLICYLDTFLIHNAFHYQA